MKFIALVGNVLAMAFMGYVMFDDFNYMDNQEMLIITLLLILSILNIIVIRSSKNEDWLSLWLRRKALEEKRKIEKLNDTR